MTGVGGAAALAGTGPRRVVQTAPVDGGGLRIPDERASEFHDRGIVVLPEVVTGSELARLRAETSAFIDAARTAPPPYDPHPRDVIHGEGHRSGAPVLRRVEYVVDRFGSCRSLAAHPYLLRTVEHLVGADFIPTWDSMVVKMPGEGIVVPWHRDASADQEGDHPIFNVDVYLDDAGTDTALWAIPGSHRWSDERARREVLERNDASAHRDGFAVDGAVQVPVHAGDVILHDILLVHGSPPVTGNALRRVVYLEHRAAHVEVERGPHTPAYVPLKQQVLAGCLAHRAADDGIEADQHPFRYAPPPPYDRYPTGAPPTFRLPHERYWRS